MPVKKIIALILLCLAAVLLAGCRGKTAPVKPAYDTGITPETLQSAAPVTEADREALDGRLEACNQALGASLTRGLTLPVLQLSLEENTITLRPAGLLMSLCADERGETAQCVFAGALKGDIRKGWGGDWKRCGLEARRAEAEGLIPLAYVDLGTSSFIPVLLVQDGQEVRVLWYPDPGVLSYSGEGELPSDYRSGVTEDTPWRLESPEIIMEGYERYLEICRLHPDNYLGLRWLSEEDYLAGTGK